MAARAPHLTAALAVAGAWVAPVRFAHAQIRASELASVSQVVDGTRLTIEYSRPRTRGRTQVFGTAVAWDEVWTPGANFATTLDVTRDVTLNGHAVPKGKYSVWMVVRKAGAWTAVLDPRAHLFHEEHPDSTAAQIRFPVRADSGAFTEVLTWSVPTLRTNGATLALEWATTRVAIDVGVTPSLAMTMAADDARPYVGTYAFKTTESGGHMAPTFIVSYADGTLKGEWVPAHPYFGRFALIRVAPDAFVPGLYDKSGQIYEVLRPDMLIQFRRANGVATGFDARDGKDVLWATGARAPSAGR